MSDAGLVDRRPNVSLQPVVRIKSVLNFREICPEQVLSFALCRGMAPISSQALSEIEVFLSSQHVVRYDNTQGKERGQATFLAVTVDALVFGVWCRYKKK